MGCGADEQRIVMAFDLGTEAAEDIAVRIDLACAERASLHVVLDASDAEARQQGWHAQNEERISRSSPCKSGSKCNSRCWTSSVPMATSCVTSLPIARNTATSRRTSVISGTPRRRIRSRDSRGRAQNGQDRVLVRGRDDGASQRNTAVNDEIGHCVLHAR
jgi:hypothetical protein